MQFIRGGVTLETKTKKRPAENDNTSHNGLDVRQTYTSGIPEFRERSVDKVHLAH